MIALAGKSGPSGGLDLLLAAPGQQSLAMQASIVKRVGYKSEQADAI